MRDPEFGETPDRRKGFVPQSYGKRLIGCVFVAVLGLYVFGPASPSRRPYICSICRMEKVDHRWLWLRWSDLGENDCSRWYRGHVERSHSHSWVTRGYCRRFGIPGINGGYACVIGGPITGLSTRVQVDIYRHFEDRLEAKRLFIRLGRRDADTYRMWKALMDWVEKDYPGSWSDWWEQHRVEAEDSDRVLGQPRPAE